MIIPKHQAVEQQLTVYGMQLHLLAILMLVSQRIPTINVMQELIVSGHQILQNVLLTFALSLQPKILAQQT
jgi:hypothetical protein